MSDLNRISFRFVTAGAILGFGLGAVFFWREPGKGTMLLPLFGVPIGAFLGAIYYGICHGKAVSPPQVKSIEQNSTDPPLSS